MDMQTLKKLCDKAFKDRGHTESLWQQIADQFYPERASFTRNLDSGDEFAQHLMTSAPIVCRRELGDAFSSMLRQGEWFAPRTLEKDVDDVLEHRDFLDQRLSPLMRKLMKARGSGFDRATTAVDHDFAAFGNGAMSVEFNRTMSGLLYRDWHLKDICWEQDETREVSAVYHRMKLSASEIMRRWPKVKDSTIRESAEKDPGKEFDIHRYVVSSEMLGDERFEKFPFVSIFLEPKECDTLEMVGSPDTIYIIPRWKLLSGSSVGFSPAAMIALPDARMIQEMACILLESGQKAVDPAIVVNRNVFREDFDFEPSGITMADIDGDGDIRKAFAELRTGGAVGQWMDQVMSVRNDLDVVWYRNLLKMPTTAHAKTATEIEEIVADHLRRTLPLFQPVEAEWSFRICDMTMNRINQANLIPMTGVPPGLRGKEIRYEFVSPMSDLAEKKKVQIFMQAQQIIAAAAAIKPEIAEIVDWSEATRNALLAGQTPAGWLRSETEMQQIQAGQAQAAASQQLLASMQQGASVVKDLSQAGVAA